MVLIGDCGEKNSEATQDAILELLIPLDKSPISFHAIQLKNPGKQPAYRTFQQQFGDSFQTAYQKRMETVLAIKFEALDFQFQVEKLSSYSFHDTPALGMPNVGESDAIRF